ncbi:MAG: hypothetical protein JWQ03_1028 [Variovorax sp.]|nr:hypothetical protein [Variovorax sp.]
MTPLMFGPPSRPLFGMYHPAEAANDKHSAVLICPPFGQESLRSHRFFKVLAERLSRSGVSTLRFDYHGSGDSPGHEHEGELDGWRRDLCVAHEELRRRVGTDRVMWIGVRLGATLAALAARGGRCDPARLVLWEPIVDGARYLRYLRERHVEALELSYCIPDPAWRRQLAKDDSDTFTDEALGTAISPQLLAQLRALTPAALPLSDLHDTIVIAEPDDEAVARWAGEQQARKLPLRLTPFRHSLMWSSDPHPNSAMVPAEALQCLLAAVHE